MHNAITSCSSYEENRFRADKLHPRWEIESRHLTSEGTVTYLRCHCGSWQTLLAEWVSGGAGSAVAAPIKVRSR